MTFFNKSKSECGQTDLSNGSVVKDLTSDVLEMNALADMSLEEQLASLVESAVKSVMIGLAKCCLDLHLGRPTCVDQLDQALNE